MPKSVCEGVLMHCPLCTSTRPSEFLTEINVHFPGIQHLDRPGVLVFPRVLVCLDCGFSWFTIPGAELAQLASAATPSQSSHKTGASGGMGLSDRSALESRRMPTLSAGSEGLTRQ